MQPGAGRMVTLVSVGTPSEEGAVERPRFGAVIAIAMAIAVVLGFAVGFAVMRLPGVGAPELGATEQPAQAK